MRVHVYSVCLYLETALLDPVGHEVNEVVDVLVYRLHSTDDKHHRR